MAIDTELEVWDLYGNKGWPARYLWDTELALHSLHYGEGAYAETEREIQALLGVAREPVAPVRPEDDPDALVAVQTEDQPGAYCGPYEAGGGVGGGRRRRRAERERRASWRSPSRAASRWSSTAATRPATLSLEPGPGVTVVHATCFTPGVVREA